jgi:hypothetical protein
MSIRWIEVTHGVWVAGRLHYRAVVIKLRNSWIARIEDGEKMYLAEVMFRNLDDAILWAELKLIQLASQSLD